MLKFKLVKDKSSQIVSEKASKSENFKVSVPISVKFTKSDDDSDVRDVEFDAYLSTFGNIDRDGDIVKQGAFTETIKQFQKNPVMLIDHKNSISSIAGSFTSISEDQNGLRVKGKISNAPDMQSLRIKMSEGHIKALSMGGRFQWDEDGVHISKVALHEGSLVAVPANPEALII